MILEGVGPLAVRHILRQAIRGRSRRLPRSSPPRTTRRARGVRIAQRLATADRREDGDEQRVVAPTKSRGTVERAEERLELFTQSVRRHLTVRRTEGVTYRYVLLSR